MVYNFTGIVNRKYKKYFGKVRFVGVRKLSSGVSPCISNVKSCFLISVGYGLLSSSEIEASRRTLRKFFGKNRKIRILIRVYPYISLTGKPSEVRMGRGKGSRIRKWVSFVKPGKIIFELKNVSSNKAMFALEKASQKLSVRSSFLSLSKLRSFKYKI